MRQKWIFLYNTLKKIQENFLDYKKRKDLLPIREQLNTIQEFTLWFIQENPSVLKRPIMIDERRFQVGYNAEEIRVFIPRELRKLAECPSKDNCPQFIGNPCNMKEAYFKSK